MYRFISFVGLVMVIRNVLALETTDSDTYYTKAQRYHLPQLFFGYEGSKRESYFPSPQFDSLDHPTGRKSVNYGNGFDDSDDGEEGRLFYFQRRTITIVLTKTSTSTLLDTCTLSTTVCAGRRRRSFLKDVAGDQLENISVAPTATQPIEATALAENVVQLAPSSDLVTSSIEPQYGRISNRRAGIDNSFNKNLFNKGVKSEIQSSLKNDVEVDPSNEDLLTSIDAASTHISLDSFHSILGQLVHGMGDYGPPTLIPAELANRQFIPFYLGVPRFKYVTKWKTTSSTFTVTSVPNCSVTGTIKQCP